MSVRTEIDNVETCLPKDAKFLLDKSGNVIGIATKDASFDYRGEREKFMNGNQETVVIEEDLLTMRPSTQKTDQDQLLIRVVKELRTRQKEYLKSLVFYKPDDIDPLGR